MVQGEYRSWNSYVDFGSTSLTLGISDAFAGGFVAGVVEGKSLDESIDMGHWLASLSIKELGPQYVHSLFNDNLPLSVHHHKYSKRWQAIASNINATSTFVPFVLSMAV